MKYEEWRQKREQAIENIKIALVQDDAAGFNAGMEIALKNFSDGEIKDLMLALRIERGGIECMITAIEDYIKEKIVP